MLEHTRIVTFELSNFCPYAPMHKKCPLHKDLPPRTLPSTVVARTLEELYHMGFTGFVAFHNYSEPLADPRLFSFIDLTTSYGMKPWIWSNGWNLTQQLLDELIEIHHIARITLTAYTANTFESLNYGLITPEITLCDPIHLDDRRFYYTIPYREEYQGYPCIRGAPLDELIINSKGHVVLCCFDWKGEKVFGDLTKETLQDVFSRGDITEAYVSLQEGKRIFDLCRRCLWHGEK